MSDVIQLLPDSVANQIAAGEVIQRPASVIKELVENAIDAGARTIRVLVVDAGRTSIQVIDDGRGMSDTDARLSFERHATSKIRKADDLFALQTMGFRGEALASIAAVAQVVLKTRMEGSEVGTQVSISGSKVTGQEPVACPVGCNFMVENLFFNVPARRKFLKTNATELNNIMTVFERIVLVYPSIGFSLHSNGAELLNLRAGSLRQRIIDVFGKRFGHGILPVGVDTAMCRISGYVGKPESARKKGAHEYFFVNGRYMKHPYFHKAVMNAFERLIPVGTQVPYFIYLEVNPADIDVNIHPTKTEIKFENEQAIWQIITAAVKDSIGKFCEIPSIDFDTEGKPDIPVFDPTRDIAPPSPDYNPTFNPFQGQPALEQTVAEKDWAIPDGWDEPKGRGGAKEKNVSTDWNATADRNVSNDVKGWDDVYKNLSQQPPHEADMFGAAGGDGVKSVFGGAADSVIFGGLHTDDGVAASGDGMPMDDGGSDGLSAFAPDGVVPAFAPDDMMPLDMPSEPLAYNDSGETAPEGNGGSDIIAEKSPAHYQYKGRFIMTAVKSGLMIIDQHRADVRIRYERCLAQMETRTASTQRNLFPEVVQFSPSDKIILEKLLPELEGMGFELTDLGGNCYAVNGIPAGIEGLDYVSLLHTMVDDSVESGSGALEEINKTLALSMARSAAIPQGQVLSNAEMENIVNELFACSNVNYTPDGKSIICILPQRDIEKLLG